MENEMVNRYRHAPNPKMYIFFNMPHSDFKMKNNNKAVFPLLFVIVLLCHAHSLHNPCFHVFGNCCHIDIFPTSPVIPMYLGSYYISLWYMCCHNAFKL